MPILLLSSHLLLPEIPAPAVPDSVLVLTEIMVDPTPSWGCPPHEYVELLNPGPGPVDLADWSLKIGSSSRVLGPGLMQPGEVAVVYDDGDSAAFNGLPGLQIQLSTWPALSNAGGRVALSGPGGLYDAMEHAGQAQNGRAWERLRAGDCGAFSNWRISGSLCGSPGQFTPSAAPIPSASESGLLNGPLATRHWLPRSPTHAELHLDAPSDPVWREGIQALIGGYPASIHWLADDTFQMQWAERLPAGPVHVAVGLLRACNAAAAPQWISGTIERHGSPHRGDLVLTEILADPVTSDPHNGSEAFELWNASSRHLELGGLRWATQHNANSHTTLAQRVILAPDETAVFAQNSVQLQMSSVSPSQTTSHPQPIPTYNWTGLTNTGGILIILASDGTSLIETAFGPCMQPDPEAVGEGLSIRRVIAPSSSSGSGSGLMWKASSPGAPSDWGAVDFTHQQFQALQPRMPAIRGFGLTKAAAPLLTVTFEQPPELPAAWWPLEVHLNGLAILDGWWTGAQWHSTAAAAALRSTSPVSAPPVSGTGSDQILSWSAPSSLLQQPMEALAQLSINFPEPAHPQQLRIEELLFDASPEGQEFIELLNTGTMPLDLNSLQAATGDLSFDDLATPSPAAWRVLCDESWVLMPGAVAAFSSCPLQAAAPFSASGPSIRQASSWPSLSDGGGQLFIRWGLPELHPPAAEDGLIDHVQWSPEMLGPWHADPEGWSLERMGPGEDQWRSCPWGATPGSPSVWSGDPIVDSPSDGDAAVLITFSGDWIHPHETPASGFEVHWDGRDAPFFIEISISDPMSGSVLARPLAGLVEASGRFFWDGRDMQGAALPPGLYAVRCTWVGPLGRGRVQRAVGISPNRTNAP